MTPPHTHTTTISSVVKGNGCHPTGQSVNMLTIHPIPVKGWYPASRLHSLTSLPPPHPPTPQAKGRGRGHVVCLQCVQDPFGERRGSFDYQSILQRLELLKEVLSQQVSDSSDVDELSDSDTEVNGEKSWPWPCLLRICVQRTSKCDRVEAGCMGDVYMYVFKSESFFFLKSLNVWQWGMILLLPFYHLVLLGIHQKFPDTRYWLDSSDEKLLHFFKEASFSSCALCHAVKTTCSTPQPRLIWVCLQQPSWTLNMHFGRCQTGYPSVVSSLLEIGRSRRESGLMWQQLHLDSSHWGSCTSIALIEAAAPR